MLSKLLMYIGGQDVSIMALLALFAAGILNLSGTTEAKGTANRGWVGLSN